jgi:hypothetical protein
MAVRRCLQRRGVGLFCWWLTAGLESKDDIKRRPIVFLSRACVASSKRAVCTIITVPIEQLDKRLKGAKKEKDMGRIGCLRLGVV